MNRVNRVYNKLAKAGLPVDHVADDELDVCDGAIFFKKDGALRDYHVQVPPAGQCNIVREIKKDNGDVAYSFFMSDSIKNITKQLFTFLQK